MLILEDVLCGTKVLLLASLHKLNNILGVVIYCRPVVFDYISYTSVDLFLYNQTICKTAQKHWQINAPVAPPVVISTCIIAIMSLLLLSRPQRLHDDCTYLSL